MIKARIKIDAQTTKDCFKYLPRFLDGNLKVCISQMGIRLSNKIKSEKLTGNPLKVQTGRLRNSIHSDFSSNKNTYTTNVGTNVKYAAIHEYGFRGSESVKTHSRTITSAFGKSISPVTFSVSSHVRKMNMPMRSFARSALAEFQGQAISLITDAVQLSIDEVF